MKRFLIYLTGKPGIGKYTTAKAISEKYNCKLCDNHTIYNPIGSLLEENYDVNGMSSLALNSMEKIRKIVYDFISNDYKDNYILTDATVAHMMEQNIGCKLKKVTESNKSIFVPVRMYLHDENEHLTRIQKPERKLTLRPTNPDLIVKSFDCFDIQDKNLLDLDITGLNTEEIVEKIMRFTESLNN